MLKDELMKPVTRLKPQHRLLLVVTFFSMFFGAGNLIFPPMLGAQAGNHTFIGATGFILSAVGLPIMGVVAVTMAGGFSQLANRVSPGFSLFLSIAIILTIGPLFAIPRTATTSFEMAVVPFTQGVSPWLSQVLYSVVFFVVAFILAQNPEKLSKKLGKYLGPLLIVLIVVFFIACFLIPDISFSAPVGDYAQHQLARGFLDGYQTMDLLAALYFGIVISANIRAIGVADESKVRTETAISGVGTGVLLVVIYAAMSYIGSVSGALVSIDPATDTGATVLTNLTLQVFGPWGTAFVGLIFILACLNVCTGLISTCSAFFHKTFPTCGGKQINYRMYSIIFTVFSFLVSNVGLSSIIKISIPVLAALYPMAIVLTLLALVHKPFSSRFPKVYGWMILLVGISSLLGCISDLLHAFGATLGPLDAVVAMLPLGEQQLGWLLPGLVGLVIGVIHSRVRPSQTPLIDATSSS